MKLLEYVTCNKCLEHKSRGGFDGLRRGKRNNIFYCRLLGTWWRSWVRHCASSRKVAGSISDGIIGIFH